MVDLTKKPFCLKEEEIRWVEKTIGEMTTEEKIGQLFIHLNTDRRPEAIREICENRHVGGIRWQGGTKEEVYEQNRNYQKYSKVPVLIAAKCETGGRDAVAGGTLVATAAACCASGTTVSAYQMGLVGGREAAVLGCNWLYSPVTDILMNWRNTIVNTRSFGGDPETVIGMSRAYIRGVQEAGLACCAKHFPGDGSEERDQHLVLGCNDLSCEEWDATYGKVYRALIEDGLESIMAGHICLPAYSRKLCPGISDEEIMPASLAPELLQGLLRDRLGFNGVILTDASHMAGMTNACPRRKQVPGAIAAGCDMYLFFNDEEEDFRYMMEGYETGIITEERLSDALYRILGLKARLNLHHREEKNRRDSLGIIGCQEHLNYAAEIADRAVTLVKDTGRKIPVDPVKSTRAKVFFIHNLSEAQSTEREETGRIIREELERAGFWVDLQEQSKAKNGTPIRRHGSTEEFRENYDVVFMFLLMKGSSRHNTVRVSWEGQFEGGVPWYTKEVPSVCISLNYTNHLIDVPMFDTFINAYAPTREYIRAAVEKIVGKTAFQGRYEETVFCDRWDTRR